MILSFSLSAYTSIQYDGEEGWVETGAKSYEKARLFILLLFPGPIILATLHPKSKLQTLSSLCHTRTVLSPPYIQDAVYLRVRICKRLRSPGIDSADLFSLAGRYDK
jgi:hypothetical protein